MNKKYLLTALAGIVVVCSSSISYAEEQSQNPPIQPRLFNGENFHKPMPINEIGEGKQPHQFWGQKPPMFDGNMHKGHPHFAKANKAEMENRLNLTAEQKQARAEQKKKSHEEMKPIFEQMKAKHIEYKAVEKDIALEDSARNQKLKEIKSDLDELKQRADEKRKEDVKNFESLLDDNQKQEFSKIQDEHKKQMEERKKYFEEMKKNKGKVELPVQPKPIPVGK